MSPRIALVHASPVAAEPIRAELAVGWPEAEAVILLDDSISVDRTCEADLGAALAGRILELARYASGIGESGILFTCSAFGPAIEPAAAELPVPVTMEAEFREEAVRLNPGARLRMILVEGAMDALAGGAAATRNRLVAERARALEGCDALMLAHSSTARAAEAVRAAVRVPVLASPEAAVARLRSLVGGS